MKVIFNEVFYRPLFNALVFLYNTVSFSDLGVAIILLTVLVRFILLPLFYKGAKDQAIIQKLAPKIKEIQENHKGDLGKQGQETMRLYREHKVSPFSSFLLLLAQFPVLIALYTLFSRGITPETLANLYSFISGPDGVNGVFLGLVDLKKTSYFIAVLAAAAQYWQGKMSVIKTNGAKELSPAERMSKNMIFIAPLLTLFIISAMPAAVGLYWLTSSVFSIIQQVAINKRLAEADEKKLVEIDKKLHGKS